MSNSIVLRNRSINLLRWSEYSLGDTGLKIREKDLRGVRENTVPYDRLGYETSYFLRHSAVAKLAVILFLIVSVLTGIVAAGHGNAEKFAWLFWLGAAVFAFIYYQNTKREGFLLASSYRSVVFSGRRLDVEAFITALLARKTEFIVKKLQERLEVAERAEVVKYLLALHDGGVLDQEQYNEIRRKAGLEDESKPKVGFA